MKESDLDALPAVQSQMKKMMQPYLESQKVIQDFVDAHHSQFNHIAQTIADFQKTANRISETINFSGILDSYKAIQKVSEQATAMLKIPQLPIIEPGQFGGLYANILEEQEALPYIFPNRQMAWQDKEDIAVMVANYIDDEQPDAVTQMEDETDLSDTVVRQLALLPLKNEGKVMVVVNGDYKNAFPVRYKKYWDTLVRLAEGERMRHEDIRGVFDYFNTHSKCPLYTNTRCQITQILGRDYEVAVFKVSVEIISSKTLKTRQNRVLKTT